MLTVDERGRMGAFLRYCIWTDRDAFLHDLRPRYILFSLMQDGIITTDERETILSHKTNRLQTQELISILGKKPPQAFDSLVKALRHDDSYPWLADKLEEKKKSNRYITEDEKEMHQHLASGGVPFQTNYLFERESELGEIRDKLLHMAEEKRWWVVLHGMLGAGKSVAAAEAVRDAYVFQNCYSSGICWVPIGKLKDKPESAILHRLQILWDKLELNSRYLSQNRQVLVMNPDIPKVQKYLKTVFAHSDKRNFLIVLDDVWDKSVVDAFDVGCPIMLTTKDRSVVSAVSEKCTYVSLDTGLDLDDTLRFLSSFVKVQPDDLPKEEIRKIHRRSKGLPLTLSLIGALMAPHGNKLSRWTHLSTAMEKGVTHVLHRHRHSSGNNSEIRHMIELTIESLDYEAKSYYFDFAIFEEDVYVPNKVFEVLWGKDKIFVEDIMYELYAKSLISLEESKTDDSYMYTVHDLYLEYLKDECRKNNDLEARHRRLVDNYLKLCEMSNGLPNYDLLPNDGYIHYYIGHHIANADAVEYFREVFLDFTFIQNKLRYAGSSDLLYDFATYRPHFDGSMKEMQHIDNFIRRNAHLLCNEDADLIQLALFEPTDSTVYENAKKSCCTRGDKVYYQWSNQGSAPYLSKLITKLDFEDLKCALFMPETDIAAAVGDNSSVILWDTTSGSEIEKLQGHCKPINHCCFNSDGKILIVASADGTVTSWLVDYSFLSTKRGFKTKRHSFPLSPGLRLGENELHGAVFAHGEDTEVLWCSFSPDNRLVASADNRGFAYVWEHDTKVLICKCSPDLDTQEHTRMVNCCQFSNSMKYVATLSGSFINLWNLSNNKVEIKLEHRNDVVNQFCFSKNERLLFSVSCYSARKWELPNCTYKEFTGNTSTSIICCCALSPNEMYFAAGRSDFCVIVWNTETLMPIANLIGHKDAVKSVNYSSSGSELVSASTDGHIIVWDMSSCVATSMVSLENNLSVKYENDLFIASSDYQNRIQVRVGIDGNLIHKSVPDAAEITACSLSNDCSEVIYGTAEGDIKVFLLASEKTESCSPGHLGRVTYLTHMKSSPMYISCSEDSTLVMWKQKERVMTFFGHRKSVVMCVLYSQESRILSCSEDGTLRVWDVNSPECVMELQGHGNQKVNQCCISADESLLCSASSDHTIKIWSAQHGQEQKTLKCEECVRSCCFSPEGEILLSGEDSGEVKLWRGIVSRDPQVRMLGSHNSWVKALKFSKDGSKYISVADSIKLWHSNGKLAQTIVLPGASTRALWTSDNFQLLVFIHNSVLYILKAIS